MRLGIQDAIFETNGFPAAFGYSGVSGQGFAHNSTGFGTISSGGFSITGNATGGWTTSAAPIWNAWEKFLATNFNRFDVSTVNFSLIVDDSWLTRVEISDLLESEQERTRGEAMEFDDPEDAIEWLHTHK